MQCLSMQVFAQAGPQAADSSGQETSSYCKDHSLRRLLHRIYNSRYVYKCTCMLCKNLLKCLQLEVEKYKLQNCCSYRRLAVRRHKSLSACGQYCPTYLTKEWLQAVNRLQVQQEDGSSAPGWSRIQNHDGFQGTQPVGQLPVGVNQFVIHTATLKVDGASLLKKPLCEFAC